MSGQSIDEKTLEFEGNDFDSSSNKRKTEMSIDSLSALPDGILIHILSFLGVEKSAVTSILSKRWRFIWTELPRIEFREYSAKSEKIRDFVAKFHKTLLMRSSMARLEKFEVNFRYSDSFASDVDSWVDFALQNKVKEVIMVLNSEEYVYALPETMCSNSSLARFSLRGCILDTLTKIEWPSLTCLHIEDSELPQHVVENILSGCPLLHTLDLEECWGFNCLDIKSQNLFILKVHDREDRENGPLLEISAPYVHTLDILLDADGRKLVLRNIKSLVRVEINFIEYWPPGEEFTSFAKELFELTLHVEELHLGRQYFQVLSELVVNGWQLPVSARKCLTVHTIRKDENNISGIFALLEFSPNLEMFVIDGFVPGEETLDEVAPGDLKCDLLHPKSVEISDPASFGGEPMKIVAQTLLKRAKILEARFFKAIDDMFEENQSLEASVHTKFDIHRAMTRSEHKKLRARLERMKARFTIDPNPGVAMEVDEDDDDDDDDEGDDDHDDEGHNDDDEGHDDDDEGDDDEGDDDDDDDDDECGDDDDDDDDVDEEINWDDDNIIGRDSGYFKCYTALKIKDDALFYTYKLIAHMVFSKYEASKIPKLERQLLWCLVNKTTPCLFPFMLGMIRHHINESKALLSFRPLIVAISHFPHELGCMNIGELYVPTPACEAAHVGESSHARHDSPPSVVPEDKDGPLDRWSRIFKAIDNMREENRVLHNLHAKLDSDRAMGRAEYKKLWANLERMEARLAVNPNSGMVRKVDKDGDNEGNDVDTEIKLG